MTFIEPVLPSMPVNVSGAAAPSSEAAPLGQLRSASYYRRGRMALKAAFGLETLGVLTGLTYLAGGRHGPAPVLLALAAVCVLAVSFAAVELAGAFFDMADVQVSLRMRKGEIGRN